MVKKTDNTGRSSFIVSSKGYCFSGAIFEEWESQTVPEEKKRDGLLGGSAEPAPN